MTLTAEGRICSCTGPASFRLALLLLRLRGWERTSGPGTLGPGTSGPGTSGPRISGLRARVSSLSLYCSSFSAFILSLFFCFFFLFLFFSFSFLVLFCFSFYSLVLFYFLVLVFYYLSCSFSFCVSSNAHYFFLKFLILF